MKITIRQPIGFSEIGRKDNQEDCVFPTFDNVNTQNQFFVLCDGMGGHENGEVASATVCEALGAYFENHVPEDGIITSELFNQALKYAYDELDKQDTGGLRKMGTTMTCIYLHKKGYLVAHIGDSRIYHVRPATGIVYQSSDHSLVNDLLRAGEITEEEAINFPQKNIITRAMQPNLERRHKADIYSFSDIQSDDYLFLCSDGVLEQLTNDTLCKILSSDAADQDKLNEIKKVCDGKTRDNFTCYLVPISNVEGDNGESEEESDDIIAGVVIDEQSCESSILQQTPKRKIPWIKIVIGVIIILSIAFASLFVLNKIQNNKQDQKVEETIEQVIDQAMKDIVEQATTTI